MSDKDAPTCKRSSMAGCNTGPGGKRRIPSRYPTTIIDRLFCALEAASGNRFCVQVVLQLDGRIDEQLVARAVRLTLEIEPYLASRFVEGWLQPYWERLESMDTDHFFEVCATDNWPDTLESVLSRQLDQERECPVKVLLLRDSIDVVCVKLDHKMGDGQAAKEYAYLLAETYSRLADDPQYAPPPNPNRDRGLTQITRTMSRAERFRLLRSLKSTKRRSGEDGEWHLPQPQQPQAGLPDSHFAIEKISPERYAAIFRYGCRHKATVSHVLLAAFIRAAAATVPHSPAGPLKVITTVDLRRHLPSKQSDVLCNLAGLAPVYVDQGAGDSLDTIVAKIRGQLYEARKAHMGLLRRVVQLEVVPRARFVFNCIPFGWLKGRIAGRMMQGAKKGRLHSHLFFTDIGPIRPDRLIFSQVGATDAFITSGTVMQQGLLLLCVTEFSGTLSMSIGYSPRLVDGDCIDVFLRTMVDNLPA